MPTLEAMTTAHTTTAETDRNALLPALPEAREERLIEPAPALSEPQITDITPMFWPLVVESRVAPYQTALFTLTLAEGEKLCLTAFAVYDLDLRLIDGFGAVAAEDLSEGALSLLEVMPSHSGEYLLEVINRSQHTTLFALKGGQ